MAATNDLRLAGTDDSWRELVATISRQCSTHDGRAPLNEQALLSLDRDGLDGATLVLTDGGFALTRGGDLTLAVAPPTRRQGIGTALLAASSEALRAWSFGDHPGARALARSANWEASRTLLQMTLPGNPPLEPRPLDPGVVIRGYRPEDAGAVVAANAEAFSWHPEQGAMTLADFQERLSQPGQGPEGLFVAVLKGDRATAAATTDRTAEQATRHLPPRSAQPAGHDTGPASEQSPGQIRENVVGFHWTKVHADGRGEVYVIGLAAAAQGHGVGRALLVHGLDDLRRRTGGADVILYVEADNVPAVGLYERIGFVVAATDVQYERHPPFTNR
ncbi:MAG: GNAT family N-acetyltransferase [Nocardioidaceae bacterium]